MVKNFVLGDFSMDEKCINAAWLREETASLRHEILGKSETLHYSVFSPWRKQVGCSDSEEISKRDALLLIFLAIYAGSGKDVCGLKAVELPHGLELKRYCKQWLEALPDRPECEAVYKVLKKIVQEIPTPKQLLKTDVLPKKGSEAMPPTMSNERHLLIAQLQTEIEVLSDEKLLSLIELLS